VYYPNINEYFDSWYDQNTTVRARNVQQQSRLDRLLSEIMINFVDAVKRYQIRRIKYQ
jgi:hypothetical protein